MKNVLIILVLITVTISCSRVKEKTKETINDSGELVGKTATEFFEGVSDGIEKTLATNILLSEDLKSKGISIGNSEITGDSLGNNNNQLVIYMIFEKVFNDTLILKAFDENNVEIGRSTKLIKGNIGDAEYFEFTFNERTVIESKSKITID